MKDIFKEKDIKGMFKIQFEHRESDQKSVRYLYPALSFTRRKGICFAILVSFWKWRTLLRVVIDKNMASKRFNFRKWLS
jgi:hypothetical protein